MAGWIKIYRDIQEHWIWQDANKLKWWLDIILMANHKDNKFLLGNELFEVKRGEFHTSELKLAERWGVSKNTIRKFLELLESDQMIEMKKSKKGTTIKINNYNAYQDVFETEKTIKKPYSEPQKDHSVNHKETTERPCTEPQKDHNVNTNKNEKNDKECKNEKESKNEKKETIKGLVDAYASPSGELNKTILDYIEMRTALKKKPTPRALKMIFTKLDKLANDEYTKIKILEQSILKSWTDVYELKEHMSSNSNNPGVNQKMQGLNNWINGRSTK